MPGICLVYTINMVSSSICMVYVWYMPGIYLDIHGIYTTKDIHGISTKCIHGISMDIHGISFDLYTWYIRGYTWIFLAS